MCQGGNNEGDLQKDEIENKGDKKIKDEHTRKDEGADEALNVPVKPKPKEQRSCGVGYAKDDQTPAEIANVVAYL